MGLHSLAYYGTVNEIGINLIVITIRQGSALIGMPIVNIYSVATPVDDPSPLLGSFRDVSST